MGGACGEAQRFRVLLVEDVADVRETLAELLEQAGLLVDSAGSAAEALAHDESPGGGEIDLLVADIHLPDGSGGDLAMTLARRHPSMRCLFLSGAMPHELSAGQAFLRKPASIRDIMRQIDALLGQPVERA